MPTPTKLTLRLHMCTRCGHVVDVRDSSPERGCFGNRTTPHPRAERIKVQVDVELDAAGRVAP